MEEKIDKFDYFLGVSIIIAILLIFSLFVYLFYQEVRLERYQNIISGEIIEVKNGEVIDPAGYVVSPGVGLALAEQASIIVKTDQEIIEVKTNDVVVNNNDLGKKAMIKELGKIKNGKKIRDKLILISIK